MADEAPEEQPNEAPPTLEQVESVETAAEDQAPPESGAPPDGAPAGSGTDSGDGAAADLPAEPQGEPAAGGEEPVAAEPGLADEAAYSWDASEYVHHHKNAAWYAALFGGVAVLVALTAWLRSWLEMAAIIVMSGAIVVYARKPPRTLRYELMADGVVIDGRKFPFGDFRSFGVIEDEDWHAVDLEPSRRLRPRMTMLFDTDDLGAIVGHLEQHLPREDRSPDLVEQVTRYLRF